MIYIHRTYNAMQPHHQTYWNVRWCGCISEPEPEDLSFLICVVIDVHGTIQGMGTVWQGEWDSWNLNRGLREKPSEQQSVQRSPLKTPTTKWSQMHTEGGELAVRPQCLMWRPYARQRSHQAQRISIMSFRKGRFLSKATAFLYRVAEFTITNDIFEKKVN